MTNTELLSYWLTEAWGKENEAVFQEMLTPETVMSGSSFPDIQPISDYRELVAAFRGLFSRVSVRILHSIEQEDWVAARISVDAENAASGSPVQFTGQLMAKFQDGRILEFHTTLDYLTMLEQLGHLPKDTLALGLSGHRLEWT